MTSIEGPVSPSRWSVRLIVPDDVAGPVSRHLLLAFDDAVHHLRIGGAWGADSANGDPEAITSVTIEIEAGTADEARVLAQHLLGRAYAAAGLEPHELPVAWVAPLAPQIASSHRFLEQARELLDSEHFEMAVVAAHVHLELHVSTLLQRALAADESPLAAVVARRRRFGAPNSHTAKPFLEALLSVKLDDFPGWKAYLAHLERRNGVVHEGQTITLEDAEASLDVVDTFWRWLNEAALGRRPTASPPRSQGSTATRPASPPPRLFEDPPPA